MSKGAVGSTFPAVSCWRAAVHALATVAREDASSSSSDFVSRERTRIYSSAAWVSPRVNSESRVANWSTLSMLASRDMIVRLCVSYFAS